MTMNWSQKKQAEIESLLSTDCVHGLTRKIAAGRLREEGKNDLYKGLSPSVSGLIRDLFFDLSHVPLAFAVFMSFSYCSFFFGLFALVFWGAFMFLYVFSYIRASQKLALFEESALPCVRVLRDGGVWSVRASSLVRGDVILLQAGDIIPCDAYLVESHGLVVNESLFEGRGTVQKQAQPDGTAVSDQPENVLFAGTCIISGSCRAVCIATGKHTVMIKQDRHAAVFSKNKPRYFEELTPFSNALSRVMVLGSVTLLACGLLYGGSLAFSQFFITVVLFASPLPVCAKGLHIIFYAACVDKLSKRKTQGVLLKNPHLADVLPDLNFMFFDSSLLNRSNDVGSILALCKQHHIHPVIFYDGTDDNLQSFAETCSPTGHARICDGRILQEDLHHISSLLLRYDVYTHASPSLKQALCQVIVASNLTVGVILPHKGDLSLMRTATVSFVQGEKEDLLISSMSASASPSFQDDVGMQRYGDAIFEGDIAAVFHAVDAVQKNKTNVCRVMAYLFTMLGLRTAFVLLGALLGTSLLPMLPLVYLTFILDIWLIYGIMYGNGRANRPPSLFWRYRSWKEFFRLFAPSIGAFVTMLAGGFSSILLIDGMSVEALSSSVCLLCTLCALYEAFFIHGAKFREKISIRICIGLSMIPVLFAIPYICSLFGSTVHMVSPILTVLSVLTYVICTYVSKKGRN